MKTENQLAPIRDIEVQLRTWDIESIKKYAQEIPENGVYLEIGTKYGGSAYLVRSVAKDSVEVWSVDPKANLYMFNGKENEVDIGWVKGYSLEVSNEWEKQINLLFIDGDHGEVCPTVPIDDFNAWEKFVVSGGIIIMHDYHPDYPAVVKACDKILETGRYELLEKPPELADRQDTDMFIVKKL